MQRIVPPAFLALFLVFLVPSYGQNTSSAATDQKSAPVPATAESQPAPAIPANAAHMSKQTRFEIIRDF